MTGSVSIEWLGTRLGQFKDRYDELSYRSVPEMVDTLVEFLSSEMKYGFGDDLDRAYVYHRKEGEGGDE